MIDRREVALTYVVLGCFSLLSLVPIVAILITAVQDPGGTAAVGEPGGLHLGNFATAWDEGHFGSYLRSSAIVAAVTTPAATLFSVLAGYAFGMLRFRGQQVLFYLLLVDSSGTTSPTSRR